MNFPDYATYHDCPAIATRSNDEHIAGIQVLSNHNANSTKGFTGASRMNHD
jgi:hypothetical protein